MRKTLRKKEKIRSNAKEYGSVFLGSSALFLCISSLVAFIGIIFGTTVGRLYIGIESGKLAEIRSLSDQALFLDVDPDIIISRETKPPLVMTHGSQYSTRLSQVVFDVKTGDSLETGIYEDFEINRDPENSSNDIVTYRVLLKNLEVGENKRTVVFTNQFGKTTSKEFQVFRQEQNVLGVSNSRVKIWLNGDDLLAVVDKDHALPSDYWPKDLVEITDFGIRVTSGKRQLRRVVIDDLKNLMDDADRSGHRLMVLSAYRSYMKQITTYESAVRIYGTARAAQRAALPGHSEHQLGTAIDFTAPGLSGANVTTMHNDPAMQWLSHNAYKYGFVLSYPEGSEGVTGYMFEPWHYRYVGREHAQRIHETNQAPVLYLKNLHWGG